MFLISLEGIDGCGKSTQIREMKNYLHDHGYEVQVFREPGGTAISEKIRELLLNSSDDIDPVTETLLFSAARAQLVNTRIRPLLKAGTIVILDRFFDSTTAYQGYGRQAIDADQLEKLNQLATGGLAPDITFYLKLDVKVAMERRAEERAMDRMERSGLEFFQRVSQGFDNIASRYQRFVTLDASLPAGKIFESIARELHDRLSISAHDNR